MVIDWMLVALLSYSRIRFQGERKVTSRANKYRSSLTPKSSCRERFSFSLSPFSEFEAHAF